jgi:hypothetical protein
MIRVFPRRTNATPTDEDCRFGPPGLFDETDEVHVSVTFTWDLPVAERLVKEWAHVAPTMIGGPGTGMAGGDFVPGRYLRPGMVVTSRGCPNRCWFCSVWRREGPGVRELAITDGWNLLDDNLLACSESHIRAVFAMLKRQLEQARFTGGLEAARLQSWHVDLLADLKPDRLYFAYDTPDDLEPLVEAERMLREAFTRASHAICAYVLCGYAGDTMEAAERRMLEVHAFGYWPFAMLWRDERGQSDQQWSRFARTWARPAATSAQIKVLMNATQGR